MRPLPRWLFPILVVTALAGCAGSPAPGNSPATTSSSPTASELSLATTPEGPYQSVLTLSLTGVPQEGVEPDCWVLDGYQLIGLPRELADGSTTLTVTGTVEDGMMTTCQQGKPLKVESAVSAPSTT